MKENLDYGVRPSERRKGYAIEMLKCALIVCKEKNMKYAILGCYENNYGILYKNGYDERKLSYEWKINLKCNYYMIELQLNKEVVRREQKIKKFNLLILYL